MTAPVRTDPTETPEPAEATMFAPVGRAPLSLLVAEQLREAIVSGALAVGSPLPTEKELTERFEVSRSTIREALRILQAEGLLSGGDSVSTARPKVSSDRTLGSAARALENVLRLGQIPLPELLDLRLLIEGAALTEAASSPAPAAIAEARDALEQMRGPSTDPMRGPSTDPMRGPQTDVAAFQAADVAFHVALVAAAGNRAFDLVLGVIRDAMAAHLLDALERIDDSGPVTQGLITEHEAILAAVERGDGDAARALLEAHVRGFYDRYATDHRDGITD